MTSLFIDFHVNGFLKPTCGGCAFKVATSSDHERPNGNTTERSVKTISDPQGLSR